MKPGQKYIPKPYHRWQTWNGMLESGRVGIDFAEHRYNVITDDGEFWIVYCNSEDQVAPMLIEYGKQAKSIHLHKPREL